MKILASFALVLPLLLTCQSAVAQELEAVLAGTAYKTDGTLADEADKSFARAMEIFGSKFSAGTASEFRSELDKSAILGHEGAAYMLCLINSNEALGTAFFRQGYFWCRVSQVYFSGKDQEQAEMAGESLAYVTKRLGSDNLHHGREYEELMLQKMLDAAKPSGPKPAAHP